MSDITKEQIEVTLRNVIDPVSGKDIVSANRIAQINIEGKQISCSLTFNQALSEEQKVQLNFACIEALERRFPSHQAHVHLEMQVRSVPNQQRPLAQIKNIIAVASGKGGVGKSTISTNLALALSKQGHQVGLIDADLYGPSIPTMLGLQGQRPKVQDHGEAAKILPLVAHGIQLISIGFIIEPEQAVVLRGPRLAGIIKQFISDCLWSELDYLVIDLPPGTGDIQLTLVQTAPVTGALIVTTPQKVSVVDAVKAANMFRMPSINVPIVGVVENMSWFTPPDLPDKKYFLFGQGGGEEMAALTESPLLAQLPLIPSIREGGDNGLPAAIDTNHPTEQQRWLDLAERLHQAVLKRNDTAAPTQRVEVKT